MLSGADLCEALSQQETRGFGYFSHMGKNGFYPRLRHLRAVRVAADMLMNDSQAEDVRFDKGGRYEQRYLKPGN